ncbi:hypothetical protein ADL15_15565 [Actinoplanes awajinensis subsp. mycoplanecinus]|uniref:Major facilitator superfamily (MFS) profile domain-containing protein n=1 Tax=Actinoplanes awajinensis subsp. mycoplanecinus TaxID=135947 RepID=A0A0X3UPJ0_9ACTN|nr:hypothetical protein ADL15_15565 [Actinoplanes awajinensis subsp. mycoplanecinus]
MLIGSVLMQPAIAFFSAVDQAIVLAVLPSRDEAGRYIAVVQFAHKLPSAIAPLIAPFIIAIGATDGEKNYTLLYLTGAGLALIGGLVVLPASSRCAERWAKGVDPQRAGSSMKAPHQRRPRRSKRRRIHRMGAGYRRGRLHHHP